MNMFESIFFEKSTGSFIQEKLEWEVLSDILQFANTLTPLISDIPIEYKLVSNVEKKQGFTGPFSIKAPYYLCLSSKEETDYLTNAGYLMQQINLYLMSKGLGTCYLGTNHPGKSLKATMKYKFVIALAFGKTTDNTSLHPVTKVLPENDIIVYKEKVNSDVKKVLQAARMAPSHYNSQPWRFVVYKNKIHVFAKKSLLLASILDHDKMIDIGIMMANLSTAAEELWVEYTIAKSDHLQKRSFQNNEYLFTLLID